MGDTGDSSDDDTDDGPADDTCDAPDGDTGDAPDDAIEFDRDSLARLFRDGRANAIIAWVQVGILALVFAESLLGVDYQWILFVGVVGLVVSLPPLGFRDWRVMLPWELLVLALLPILVRGLVGGSVGVFATYLSLAAFALLVIVELHMFTSLRATAWFAVGLVVLTTMAAVALWTVFRWHTDQYVGTTYLVDNETLMLEWLSVTTAGVVAGILFESYFRRRDRILWRTIRRTISR